MTPETMRALLKAVIFDPPWVMPQDGGFNIGNAYFITPLPAGVFKLERADFIGTPGTEPGEDSPDDYEMKFIADGTSLERLVVLMTQDLAKWRMTDEIRHRLGVKA